MKQLAVALLLPPGATQAINDARTKFGSTRARSAPPHIAMLYMSALVATRRNPVISHYYVRLCASGKAKKVALVACMRKLLIILNSMLKHHVPWHSAACLSIQQS
jgi:transposase